MIWKFLTGLSIKTWLIIGGVVLLFAFVGYVGKLSRDARNAEAEAQRQKNKAEGLEVLINANTVAGEVEKLKEKENEQATNSNLSNGEFFNSLRRDSNLFTGNYSAARKRFCENFPADSRCH